MIGKLNHVAIAVPDVQAAARIYRDVLGAQVSQAVPQPEHGVTTVFVELPNTKLELIEPLGDDSPIANFFRKNAAGGIHHICFEVEDIDQACRALEEQGVRIIGDGKPKAGAHGNPVVFLHPKDLCGTLIELEEVKSAGA